MAYTHLNWHTNVSSSERMMTTKMSLGCNDPQPAREETNLRSLSDAVLQQHVFLLLSTPYFHSFLPSGQKSTGITILLHAHVPWPHTNTHRPTSTPKPLHHRSEHPSIWGTMQIPPNINSALAIKTEGSKLRSHAIILGLRGWNSFPLRSPNNSFQKRVK